MSELIYFSLFSEFQNDAFNKEEIIMAEDKEEEKNEDEEEDKEEETEEVKTRGDPIVKFQ